MKLTKTSDLRPFLADFFAQTCEHGPIIQTCEHGPIIAHGPLQEPSMEVWNRTILVQKENEFVVWTQCFPNYPANTDGAYLHHGDYFQVEDYAQAVARFGERVKDGAASVVRQAENKFLNYGWRAGKGGATRIDCPISFNGKKLTQEQRIDWVKGNTAYWDSNKTA
jgi:hypothetical protein